MDIKKSKILKAEMLPEWSNANGTFYPHKVEFENGDIAIANKKTQNAFTINQEIQYILDGVDNLGNKRFKEHRESTYSGGGKKGSNASFALSYAKDITVARINTGLEADKDLMNECIKTANIFNKWLNEN